MEQNNQPSVKNATPTQDPSEKTLQNANWVCQTCGTKYGRGISRTKRQFTISTWHTDNCDVCGKHTEVTETRDFGYLTGQKRHPFDLVEGTFTEE